MRLRYSKIFAALLLCLLPEMSLWAQATPPPPIPPPPVGLPIDDYIPVMIIVALIVGIYVLSKFKFEKTP